MLPTGLQCTECYELLSFPSQDRAYYIGSIESPKAILESDYLGMQLDPIWCSDCSKPSWVEAIPSLRQLEKAFALVKSNLEIEYPFPSKFLSTEEAISLLYDYLAWATKRKSKAKCVVCGKRNYTVLGGNLVKLRHKHCDYGVFKPTYTISSHNAPMKTVIHNTEGEEIGRLSYWDEKLNGWSFIKADEST